MIAVLRPKGRHFRPSRPASRAGASKEAPPSRRGLRRGLPDLAGLGSVVAMALAYLSPALVDGFSFGPYDAGSNGTIGHPGGRLLQPVYNRLNGDLVNQAIPWNALNWHLVHSGQLPLWNPYSVLGLPQLFNFESAGFSLPDLVSYAVPAGVAFFVVVLVKLLLAGTGTYVLSRLVGARPLAASFGGITFMLSGAFANWIGWSLSGVVALAPFVVCFILLAYRDPRRRYVVGLAVSVTFAFYGGFPEMYLLAAAALLAFLVAGALGLYATGRRPELRGSARALGGLVAGVVLAAPLLWPGEQLVALSTRTAAHPEDAGLPISFLSLVVSPAYYGEPIRGSITFPGVNYYETVAYLGVVAVALALTGLVLARRQAAVVALAGLSLVCLVSSYRVGSVDPAAAVLNALGFGAVHSSRIRLVTGLGVAVLGAVGLEQLLRRPRPAVRLTWLFSALGGAVAVAALVASSAGASLSGAEAALRARALVWPAALAVVLVVSAVVLLVAGRHNRPLGPRWRRPLGLGLVGAQAAFLLFAGVGLNSYSRAGFRPYPAALELRQLVGRGVVGLDSRLAGLPNRWPRIGFYPNLNVAYEVAEFAAHDPLLPAGYARAFPISRDGTVVLSALNMPQITTAAEARADGIEYLLVTPTLQPPSGTVPVATIDGEHLVRVKGASRFFFESSSGNRAARVVSWSQRADNEWQVRVVAPGGAATARRLVLGLSDVPGFEVTDGGRRLSVSRHHGFEMAVTVPPGRSTVRIRYWPAAFTRGLVLAAAAAVGLGGYCALPLLWRRRRRARA